MKSNGIMGTQKKKSISQNNDFTDNSPYHSDDDYKVNQYKNNNRRRNRSRVHDLRNNQHSSAWQSDGHEFLK